MKKRMSLIAVLILVTLPCVVNSQTVQIGLSHSLGYVLGGPFYSTKSLVIAYPTPFDPPDPYNIRYLGLKESLGYEITAKVLKPPGILLFAQLEHHLLQNPHGACIDNWSAASSIMHPLNKVTASILAFNLGGGYRFLREGALPYWAGTLIFSRIGDINIKSEFTGPPIDLTIEAKNRLGLGCIFGVEWPLSKKFYLDAQFHLKSYALFMREENEDDFITTGLSVGLLYTLTSPEN